MPSSAVGQRALLVCTPHGNVLWDCISLIDQATVTLTPGTMEALGPAIGPARVKAAQRVRSQNRTNITYFMSRTMHQKLKRAAVDHNTSLQQLLDEAVDLLFAEYGLGPLEPWHAKSDRGEESR